MTITAARIRELENKLEAACRCGNVAAAEAIKVGIREGLDVAAQYLTDQTFGQHIPDAIRSVHIEGEETEK